MEKAVRGKLSVKFIVRIRLPSTLQLGSEINKLHDDITTYTHRGLTSYRVCSELFRTVRNKSISV